MYADDTTLHIAGNNPHDVIYHLQSAMDRLLKWLEINRLVLNVDKTKFMFIGSSRKLNFIKRDEINVTVKGKTLEIVDSAKILGMQIDSQLKFHKHVESISQKISGKIGFLCRLKASIPRKELSLLFKALVNPHFDYCSSVWSGASAANNDKLFKLQKRGLRMICNAPWNAPSKDLFSELDWMPLPELLVGNDCKMLYKCMNDQAPNYLCKCFTLFDNNIYSTRQWTSKTLMLPRCKTSMYRKSFVFRGTKIWNSLEQDIKCCKSLSTFKHKLKTNSTLPLLAQHFYLF
ncbi:RNA-directed DNA polymerase from mobile element jockey [Holothuria leucospilota]|uniref:RNA-directed DNA polymerase from mobile element jockey n=1 Tax=Holothuria leucospilota TaxID=206669 RepID=A0A9Q0YHD6_HOLLE|nr:RNA-directed DNA polymerase from mobile element jockey [Holothuria leucospilota]